VKFKVPRLVKAGDKVVDETILRDRINHFFWVEKIN